MNCSANPQTLSARRNLSHLCGTQILFRDRYKILRILGRGGFGVTFLAKDTALPTHPTCVIKQLCPKVTHPQSWERARIRFQKEAKILAQLGSHSQIPMLLNYFESQGEFYLVQEYIPGLNLAQEVKQNGPKTESDVKRFLQELLPVLRYVHKNRVIHRDIKPHNLLRCKDDGRLVLIDFGAVKEELYHLSTNSHHQSANTNFVGTIGFAPPEQLCLRPVYASDIYAVGITCLYLLTGKSPVEFDRDPNTGEINWQKQVNLSQHFAQILSKMLKICLKERFQSVDDVIWALSMESYLPTLTNCLSTQQLAGSPKVTEQQPRDEYLPPLARTAKKIQQWQAKLKKHCQLKVYDVSH
jgi:serine/threonine-protein kinase